MILGSLVLNSLSNIVQRNLDQLEALSKKLRSKTVRSEAPSQSIAATRYCFVVVVVVNA